ncbi:MAG: MFS transporter [Alphaproteobacteria bacterium]|nr:MFS transporter [Alphaproteobacteria bacterium]
MASLAAIRSVLSQRNTRIFYGTSALSWTGLWVQQIATDWLAWTLTHSALWVGILAFCNLGPSVFISPFAGAVSDRIDRLRLTIVTQLITAAHAAILIVLVLTDTIRVEYMAILQVLLGISQSFAQPARQSLVPGMVSRADLPGAVALNSLTYNIARSVGPGIGGLLVAVGGVVPGMVVNCIGYLIASATMPLLRLDPATRRGHPPTGRSVLREALDGIRYVARHPGMAPLFIYAAVIGILTRSVPEMLSPYVAGLWDKGPEGLATLATTMGVSAMVGGLYVAVRGRLAGLARIAVLAGLVMAGSTGLMVATHSFTFAVICAVAIGAAGTMHGISAQTLLQSGTPSHILGRVLSLWGMITRAAPAIGALLYGALTEVAGLQAPVVIGSCIAAGCTIWALRRLPQITRFLERPTAKDKHA